MTFVFAWLVGGFVQDGYSPMDDAISQLAAVDAPARGLMTFGLAAFAAGMLLFGATVREHVEGPAWIAAMVTGLATIAVAATPLGRTAAADELHAGFAVAGYLSLVAVPLLAAGRLNRPDCARLSAFVGVIAGVCLVASVLEVLAPGWLQRAGLTLVHSWVVGISGSLLREGPPVAPRVPS